MQIKQIMYKCTYITLFTSMIYFSLNIVNVQAIEKIDNQNSTAYVIVAEGDNPLLSENPLYDKQDAVKNLDKTLELAIEDAKEQENERKLKEQENAEVAEIIEPIETIEVFTDVGVCHTYSNGFKSWMPVNAIATNSTQNQIITNQTYTTYDGLLMTNDGYVGVALGSYYGPLGGKFQITTDTGNVFKVIKVEAKSDKDVVNGCYHVSNNSILEFVIESGLVTQYHPEVIIDGTLSSLPQYNGNIIKIEMLR